MKIEKISYVFSTAYAVLGVELYVRLLPYLNLDVSGFNTNTILNLFVMISFMFIWFVIPIAIRKVFENSESNKKISKYKKFNLDKKSEVIDNIIKFYSPAEINYICDKKCNDVKDVALTLLSLNLKKKIAFVEDKIVITDKDMSFYEYEFKKSEKYIFDSIKDGKVHFDSNDSTFRQLSVSEALEDGLVSVNVEKNVKYNLTSKLLDTIFSFISIIITIAFFAVRMTTVFETPYTNTIFAVAITLMIMFVMYNLISKYYSEFNNLLNKNMAKTYKGEDLDKNIIALKSFMKYTDTDLSDWNYYEFFNAMFDSKNEKIQELYKMFELHYCENK